MTATTGKKISELSLVTPETGDYVPGVDASTGLTKRFLISTFAKITAMLGTTSYGPRASLRFIPGATTTINIADDAVNDRVDVTIDTTLGPSSVAHKHYLWSNFR